MLEINPNDVYPRSNLDPNSVDWGRRIQDDVTDLKKAFLASGMSLTGLNRSTAAQLAGVSDQLAALLETQALIQETQDIIQATQETQGQQQQEILSLLSKVTVARAGSNEETNFSLSPSTFTINTVSIPVPTGFNRAVVFATHSVAARVGVSGTDYLWVQVRIAGIDGSGVFTQGSDTPGTTWPSATATSTRVVENPSGSISIAGRAGAQEGSWPSNASNRSVLSAMATFYND